MAITKDQITDSVYTQLDLPKYRSVQVFESLLEIMKKTLENGEDVLISGFGRFCVRDKKKKRGRNPQTGEDKLLRARRVVVFKCSGRLKDRINAKKKGHKK